MTKVFGEVAALYDDVRVSYPDDVSAAILEFAGRPPRTIAEIGAGTGKGTRLLARLGAEITALEPDPRMAAVLHANFPEVSVITTSFEEWRPPDGGVDLLACASAWHWTDPATRQRRAFDALADGGVLAVFLHRYGFDDPAQGAAIEELMSRTGPRTPQREPDWPFGEMSAAGIWASVERRGWHTSPELGRERYLALVQTFGPFRHRTPENRNRTLDSLGVLLDDFGGSVVLDVRTTLVLARR